MLEIVHNKMAEFIVKTFEKYGINIQAQYNSEIGIIKQYIGSLNYRYMYRDLTLPGLTDEDLEKLQKESYNLLLYKYSPLKKTDDRLNNISFEAVFTTEMSDFQKIKIEDENVLEFVKYIREEINTDPNNYIVRDLILGTINYEFQIISSSTKIINDLQFLYCKEFLRPRIFTITVLIGDKPIELDYQVNFEEISDVGHIDFEKYGNLQQLSFTCELTGPILNNFESEYPTLKEIDYKLDFKG